MKMLPEILISEASFAAVNKPSGMLCEGGGDREQDLESWVTAATGKRAWCCHRLDRPTSGVVVLGLGKRHSRELGRIFEERKVRKEYFLLVDGLWPRGLNRMASRIAPLGGGRWANVEEGGKEALSTFQLLGSDAAGEVSWLRGLLKTGRTHQLRLHALKAGFPIVGDGRYGRERVDGLFGLHARKLVLPHPEGGALLELVAPVPVKWREAFAGRFAFE